MLSTIGLRDLTVARPPVHYNQPVKAQLFESQFIHGQAHNVGPEHNVGYGTCYDYSGILAIAVRPYRLQLRSSLFVIGTPSSKVPETSYYPTITLSCPLSSHAVREISKRSTARNGEGCGQRTSLYHRSVKPLFPFL